MMRLWRIPLLLVLVALIIECGQGRLQAADATFVDDFVEQVRIAASNSSVRIKQAAWVIFGALALISIVWRFGLLMFDSGANIGSVFSEMIRFFVVLGFFGFLLQNGNRIGESIIDGLATLGTLVDPNASFKPSAILGEALKVIMHLLGGLRGPSWTEALKMLVSDEARLNYAGSQLAILAMAFLVLVFSVALVSILVYHLIAGYLLCYCGVFYSAFGASEWTRQMVINYLKSILKTAVNIMILYLLIKMFQDIMQAAFDNFTAVDTTQTFKLLATVVMMAIIFNVLAFRVPGTIAAIASGIGMGNYTVLTMSNLKEAGKAVATKGASLAKKVAEQADPIKNSKGGKGSGSSADGDKTKAKHNKNDAK